MEILNKRGSLYAVDSYTGKEGEIAVCLDDKSIRIFDSVKKGGYRVSTNTRPLLNDIYNLSFKNLTVRKLQKVLTQWIYDLQEQTESRCLLCDQYNLFNYWVKGELDSESSGSSLVTITSTGCYTHLNEKNYGCIIISSYNENNFLIAHLNADIWSKAYPIQTGHNTQTGTVSSTSGTVTFQYPFINTPVVVTGIKLNGNYCTTFGIETVTNTGFTYNRKNQSGSGMGSVPGYWVAIGY